MGEGITEAVGVQAATWETLERWVQEKVQELIQEVLELAVPNIMGGKPCGAGGGGCIFFTAKSDGDKQRLRTKLRSRNLEPPDVTFDFDGLVLLSRPGTESTWPKDACWCKETEDATED